MLQVDKLAKPVSFSAELPLFWHTQTIEKLLVTSLTSAETQSYVVHFTCLSTGRTVDSKPVLTWVEAKAIKSLYQGPVGRPRKGEARVA